MQTLLTLLIYTAIPALGAGLIGFALAEMKNRWHIEEREEERRFVQAILETDRAGGQQ